MKTIHELTMESIQIESNIAALMNAISDYLDDVCELPEENWDIAGDLEDVLNFLKARC